MSGSTEVNIAHSIPQGSLPVNTQANESTALQESLKCYIRTYGTVSNDARGNTCKYTITQKQVMDAGIKTQENNDSSCTEDQDVKNSEEPCLRDSTEVKFVNSLDVAREKDTQLWNMSKRRKRLLMLVMAIMDMFGGMMFSMIGPFFPTVARQKGTTPLMSGIVMGSYELAMIIAAPLIGSFISRIGVRFVYTSGIAVAGICSILFGALYWCPKTWFIPLCVIVRLMQGVGFAAYITSTYAILVTLFTDDMASIFGLLETMKGIGFMIGPIIGSGLYELGGYMTPFGVIGIVILLVGVAISGLIPRHTPSVKSEVSIWILFTIPIEVVCAFIHATLAFMLSNFDATFALHLEQFDLKQIYIGLMFFAPAAGYCASSPLVGKATDKWPHLAYIMLITGFTLCSIFILITAPAPFLPIPSDNLVLTAVSLTFVGVFAATAVVTFTIMFSVARLYNFPDTIDTYGKISGFVEGFYNTGAFIGPIAGSYAYQSIGWQWSFSIPAFMFLACLLVLMVLLLRQKLVHGVAITSGLVPKEESTVDCASSSTDPAHNETTAKKLLSDRTDIGPEIFVTQTDDEIKTEKNVDIALCTGHQLLNENT